MMKKEKLLVHEKEDVTDNTKGHYYCYTQEHGKLILKDSGESKLKVITEMSMKVKLEKIAKNEKKYTVFYLTSNHPFDPEEEAKQNKLFSQVKNIMEKDNFEDFQDFKDKGLASHFNLNELLLEGSPMKEGDLVGDAKKRRVNENV